MNEKVARQIEEMKKQTIGVEVEMNNITRDKAARVAARYFGTHRMRTLQAATDTAHGQHGMHRAGNGNFRRTSALQAQIAKNAKWLLRFWPTRI